MASALFWSTESDGSRCPDWDAITTPAPARGYVAEFFKHERGAVQIDLEDRFRRGLARGDAGGMDETGDLANARGLLDETSHGRA